MLFRFMGWFEIGLGVASGFEGVAASFLSLSLSHLRERGRWGLMICMHVRATHNR